jgi:probable phosphomutase (TIGR03848 family)
MCDHVGRELAGRKPDVHLNAAGRLQAERLAEQLDAIHLDAVISSPLPRARETAASIAERRKLELRIEDDLTEIDYGHWTGKKMDTLASESLWTRYNTLRSVARIPGGEQMLDVQARALAVLDALRRAHPDGCCAVVSHGDVIRSIVAHCAGIPLDLFQRLEIGPASVSVVVLAESWIGVRSMNVPIEGLSQIV